MQAAGPQPLKLPFSSFRVLWGSKQHKELAATKSGFTYGFEFSRVKELVPQISGTILKTASLNKRCEDAGRCRYVS